ncbi:SH3 domain-containing protein [Bradyrhizobium sp. 139]|uniref:SH3 domain-containing protein n=1 Tax=Bradyrhizobium sp. 139 TaxID=2782616 RepID=UPI001FF97B5F|nr:SH3 domain-containing protein [Bradyrhizobium sp. 139]MCK1743770.1 SH3 domain-containing protein [Bradyrhizobium sp. 139]
MLQIKPAPGATVVRGLSAKTTVTVLESKNGWSLIAREGKPLGYVATRDLAPVR